MDFNIFAQNLNIKTFPPPSRHNLIDADNDIDAIKVQT